MLVALSIVIQRRRGSEETVVVFFAFFFSWERIKLVREVKFLVLTRFWFIPQYWRNQEEGTPVCIQAVVAEHLIVALPKVAWIAVRLMCVWNSQLQSVPVETRLRISALLSFCSKCYSFELSYFDIPLVLCAVLGWRRRGVVTQCCELENPRVFSEGKSLGFVYLGFQRVEWGGRTLRLLTRTAL